ncbi:MAG: hypothetical protein L0177_06465 [Chloroflexi bacterium]|nr:hypothetical protein [Chloroflexota bacterium]
MPQPKIPQYWRDMVFSQLANNARTSDKRIHHQLKEKAEELRKSDNPKERELAVWFPSEATIGRIRRDEWPKLEESKRAQHRYFHWPESMEHNDLPWEASPAALELLGQMDYHFHGFYRPSIRATEMFWRVSQSVPDAHFWARLEATALLMAAQDTGTFGTNRETEWIFAYGVWRNEKNRHRYIGASKRVHNPLPQPAAWSVEKYDLAGVSSDTSRMLAFVRTIPFNEAQEKWLESGDVRLSEEAVERLAAALDVNAENINLSPEELGALLRRINLLPFTRTEE